MKLDFEIAVDQQTWARDRTFQGGPDSGCPRDSHAHIWSICGPILTNDINMIKTPYHISSKLDKNWPSYEQNTICPYLGIRTKYDRFWPINWANINIFKWNQLYMKGKPELHLIYEYQLNTYVTVDSVVK